MWDKVWHFAPRQKLALCTFCAPIEACIPGTQMTRKLWLEKGMFWTIYSATRWIILWKSQRYYFIAAAQNPARQIHCIFSAAIPANSNWVEDSMEQIQTSCSIYTWDKSCRWYTHIEVATITTRGWTQWGVVSCGTSYGWQIPKASGNTHSLCNQISNWQQWSLRGHQWVPAEDIAVGDIMHTSELLCKRFATDRCS